MQPHTDFKFHPQVTQIGYYWGVDGHAEVYLLEGDTLVLIDTGCADTPDKFLKPAVESAGYTLGDIGLILNTHGHYDHSSGNQTVVGASGAEVWLSQADESIAGDFRIQFDQYFADRDHLTQRPDRLAQAYAEIGQYAASTQVNRYLNDGQQVDLGRGIRLRVLHTPGHSAGSVVFYWEEEGMLFTGDSVVGGGSRVGGLPWIFFPTLYADSLNTLHALEIETLCLSHHYFSLTQHRSSVKLGEAGRIFIRESRQILDILMSSIHEILSTLPDATIQEVIRYVLPSISRYLSVEIDDETGFPTRLGAAGTLRAICNDLKRHNPAIL